jgi:hypothetical protein
LPSDLSYIFNWPSTDNAAKDAVLKDSEQSIKAVDLAIANQDPLDKGYRFHDEGKAATQTQQFIKAYVKAKARATGSYRYTKRVSGSSKSFSRRGIAPSARTERQSQPNPRAHRSGKTSL